MFRAGSIVTWNHRGGRASGKIIKITRGGKLKVPKSSLTLNTSADDPAALIRLIKDNKLTTIVVGHKLSSLKPVRGLTRS